MKDKLYTLFHKMQMPEVYIVVTLKLHILLL